jgi:hypothetical protein
LLRGGLRRALPRMQRRSHERPRDQRDRRDEEERASH